jgi:ligand-binding sensor domain-containing protein
VRILLIGLVAVGFAAPASALDPLKAVAQYVHDQYQARDGLPHDFVGALAQARDGYLWIGTQEGLVRFDGGRFRVYDPRNTPALTSPWVTALFEDGAGDLWIGTVGGVVLRKRGEEFRAFGPAQGIPIGRTTSIAGDSKGRVWVGTTAGLALWRDGSFSRLGARDGLPDGEIRALQEDGEGTLWVGTRGGLFRLDGDRFLPGPKALLGVPIDSVAKVRDGSLWAALHERGLARVHGDAVSFLGLQDGLPSMDVTAVVEDRDGNLWLGTESGLARLAPGQKRVEVLPIQEGLAEDGIRSLLEDREGSIWFGTESSGLHRLRDGDFVTFGAPEGLWNERVESIIEDRAGGFWLGTGGGFEYFFGGKFRHFGRETGVAGRVLSLLEDRRGEVWVGTSGGGVGRVLGDGRVAWYGRAEGLADLKVRALYEDRAGQLWAGTQRGLHRRVGERFEQVPAQGSLEPDQVVVDSLAEDARGTLWLGTQGHGLLQVREGRLAVPAGAPLAGVFIITLSADPDGTLWIGTLGRGLFRYRDGQLARFTTREGLFDDLAHRILDDGRGSLWLSCNHGVFRVARSELEEVAAGLRAAVTSVAYGTDDGMRNRECNGGWPGGFRSRDGRLWFATVRGLAVVDPSRLRPEAPPPPAVVEQISVDGAAVPQGLDVDLPRGTGRVEVAYSALGFNARDRIRFRYRLEGFDRDWVDAGAAPVAHYTNLPPGRFRFLVQASIGGGRWGAQARIPEIRLRPHFTQTAWFLGACLSAVALGLWAGYRARVRALRRRERELSARVEAALAEVKVLEGLLPICAWCKKVRDDKGYWTQIETYVSLHSRAQFSHGMCPDCFARIDREERDEGSGGGS